MSDFCLFVPSLWTRGFVEPKKIQSQIEGGNMFCSRFLRAFCLLEYFFVFSSLFVFLSPFFVKADESKPRAFEGWDVEDDERGKKHCQGNTQAGH